MSSVSSECKVYIGVIVFYNKFYKFSDCYIFKMTEIEEKTYSYDEFMREFFPGTFLERLKEHICSPNLEGHIYDEVKPNQTTGTLEFYQTGEYLLSGVVDLIENSIVSFYKKEGFKVEIGGKVISAEKGRKEYWIMVLGSNNSYEVIVTESPFSEN